jgi:hypothetical protein
MISIAIDSYQPSFAEPVSLSRKRVRPVNQHTSKCINGLERFKPRELHKQLSRGSQLDRSTLRQEAEHPNQAWPWSGLARFGRTPPTRARRLFDASVDQTEARNAPAPRRGRIAVNSHCVTRR